MTTVMRTARVLLREFNAADLDVVAALMADKDQMSSYPRPRTREEALAWIERNLALYENYGFGFWLMEVVGGSEFLGYCGIRPRWIEGIEEIEMGWHTKKELWGQGLATEAATGCRDLAFTRFDIRRLVATIDADNAASLRVAEKIGMKFEKEAVHSLDEWPEAVVGEWPCLVYSISRAQLDLGTK